MRISSNVRGNQALTTASVAQMVDAPEATWVLYFLRSLLRVASSMFQALRSGIMTVLVW